MKKKRQSHNGKPRNLFRGVQGKPPPVVTDGVPFFSLQNYPLIRKRLVQAVKNCEHRKDTGELTTAPCCRTENGKVFECKLYGHKPAKLYDCLLCQKKLAIENQEQWIKPLSQLSRGSAVPQSLQEVQSQVGASETPQTGQPKELPGRVDSP